MISALLKDIDVVDEGTGPVVALAHGAGGGVRENFGPLISAAGDLRFVGPYYPGAGKTPLATEPLSLERLADTVVAAALETGAERFPVAGLSLGAAVAVTAAVRHPSHVSGLVLTVGVARHDAQLRAYATVWRRLAEREDFDALAELMLHAAGSPAALAALSPADHAEAVRQIRQGYPAGGAAHAELAARTDVTPLLGAIDVPTLVVVGGQDRIVLPDTARLFATGIRGAELVEYPGAGHIFSPPEAARWASDVLPFLRRVVA
ncbi:MULTISPECIES: alpha/beta fold hydrolase [Amycolatopsis]|uniref:Pimeloyl-ACP methyl ester carboxylesterase n=2 Tax=Amycolatopsis TaxID=1813 RepID=A0A1I4B3M4_9PSEU|nr:alpha/beta hydrolase [Amycolatopsis sacchari]SFK62476.1 Pimeloyl-ACP methyl ester carboxylesterase [Amycolatopsis sacchari]